MERLAGLKSDDRCCKEAHLALLTIVELMLMYWAAQHQVGPTDTSLVAVGEWLGTGKGA